MRSTPDRRKAIFSAAVLPELEAITREIARGRAAGDGRWVAMDGALQMSVDNCELNRKLIHLSTRHNQPREPRSVTHTQTDSLVVDMAATATEKCSTLSSVYILRVVTVESFPLF